MIVGVCGAGTMGAGIAQVCLAAGHEVLLYDVDHEAIDRGRERIRAGLARLVEKGRLEAAARDEMLDAVRDAHDLGALGEEAELVIEAAYEDLDLKRTIFRSLDRSARPEAMLATNTSALSVTDIAAATSHPGRVLGLHFFNPAPVMPLVEVVAGEATRADVHARGMEFARGSGKTPVACRDAPGFIVNRVNRPFTLEALRLVDDDSAGGPVATIDQVDRAIEASGYPMGPFRLMDLVGIDVNLAVAKALYEAFDHEARFRPSPLQEALVAAGTLGRKSGRGFYRYDEGGAAVADDGPVDVPGRGGTTVAPRSTVSDREIVERIELAIVNEAYHAVGEDVAAPDDIDRAIKLGAGHPHGPFERAGTLGLRRVIEGLQGLQQLEGDRFRPAPALWSVATL